MNNIVRSVCSLDRAFRPGEPSWCASIQDNEFPDSRRRDPRSYCIYDASSFETWSKRRFPRIEFIFAATGHKISMVDARARELDPYLTWPRFGIWHFVNFENIR
jgi:hypothetical protein